MAKKRYPRSESTEVRQSYDGEAAYLSYTDATRNKAMETYSKTVQEYTAISSRTRDFSDLVSKTSGRPGLRWSDYDWFRTDEAVPTKLKDILSACNQAYEKVGLIRNVIDLMGDFACQGIRLVHPNKRIEKFYRNWFKRVQGKDRSERFLNLLYRSANVPIRIKTAKVDKRKREIMQRSIAQVDMEAIVKDVMFLKGEIPWQYVFLDARMVDVIGGSLASFVGEKQYALTLPVQLRNVIEQAKHNPELAKLLSQIPTDIRQAVEKPGHSILLNQDKTKVYHYKKDDWQEWALPMIYACLEDIHTLTKLKLADRAALDGAISKIRVWKLGSLEHKLAPLPAAASTLSDILENNVGGGTTDIVWGPDIELIESDTNVHQFLGEEKYKPTLVNIYTCLGIPPTLTGTFGAGGTTNNFISLKTLTERLKYGRGKLVEFWEEQCQIVQRAMGFRFPAAVEFDYVNLDDPASIHQLLTNLADRNVISNEFVRYQIGANPEMEDVRIKREELQRERNQMPEKASPYHDPDKEHTIKRTFAQTGAVTPSELDIELKPKKKGEKTALEQRQPTGMGSPPGKKPAKKGGTPGRPKNTPDSKPRKKKSFSPKLKASLELWAKEAQQIISEVLNPGILSLYDKKNMRSLSKAETAYAEKVKFEVLCNIEPTSVINSDVIHEALQQGPFYGNLHTDLDDLVRETEKMVNHKLSVDDIRSIKASCYIDIYLGDE